MNRATFLKRCGLIAAGVVAADQIDLLERLTYQPKRLWPGTSFERRIPLEISKGYGIAEIEDGGYEVIVPTYGTIGMVQVNRRYEFTGFAVDPHCPANTIYVRKRVLS